MSSGVPPAQDTTQGAEMRLGERLEGFFKVFRNPASTHRDKAEALDQAIHDLHLFVSEVAVEHARQAQVARERERTGADEG